MAMDIGSSGGKPGRAVPAMNVTPLVDVVLVLLIIFMVITPMLAKQFWLHLPNKVDQDEPVGVLRLCRADQAPGGRAGRVGAVLAGRAPGQHDQPGVGEPLVGQPGLGQHQHPVAGFPCGGNGFTRHVQGDQHGVGVGLGQVGGGVDGQARVAQGRRDLVGVAEHGVAGERIRDRGRGGHPVHSEQ